MARETALERTKRELDHATATAQRLGEENGRLERERDQWRTAHLPDREAEALAGCARALEAMTSGHNGEVTAYATGGFVHLDTYANRQAPKATDSPVGRILLALAGRYDVPIAAVPPVVNRPERVLLSVPAELAEQIERLAPGIDRA